MLRNGYTFGRGAPINTIDVFSKCRVAEKKHFLLVMLYMQRIYLFYMIRSPNVATALLEFLIAPLPGETNMDKFSGEISDLRPQLVYRLQWILIFSHFYYPV